MKYYIIKNKEMPWGDYGNILFSGFLKVMDRNYNDLEVPELQRSGPYIPEFYIANSRNIIVTDLVKHILEQSNIKGINKFKHIIKKKIVNIDWQSWDKDKEPLFYPDSGEPEDYILKGKHSEQIATSMPNVWELEVAEAYNLSKVSGKRDKITYSHLALIEEPQLDIFLPTNMLFVIVSERFKSLLENNDIRTLRFIEISKVFYPNIS